MFDKFEMNQTSYIGNDFNADGILKIYVEMTLSGCKYLCQYLQDHTCSQIIFVPNTRSCILQPLRNVQMMQDFSGCQVVEMYQTSQARYLLVS